jgi:CheY-like chemotaxis protein
MDTQVGRRRPQDYPFCVLVCDRDVQGANALVRQIRELGHMAHSVQESGDALQAAETLLPHVMLLSLPAPLAAHSALTRRIRSVLGLEQSYLVAVSDYDPDTTRPSILEAGFDDLLWKPIGAKLLEALMKYLSLKLRDIEAERPEGGCAD